MMALTSRIGESMKTIEDSNLRNKQESEELARLPHVGDLCVSHPLYRAVRTSNRIYLKAIRGETIQFDAYCVWCEKESTFKDRRSRGGGAGTHTPADWMLAPAQFDITVFCQRADHKYIFLFDYRDGILTKFGQMPSLEDIAGHDILKFKPLLRDGYFQELRRATGLASHGIGIGAFVYLRRIFEKLIHDHHRDFAERNDTIKGFDTLRMDEKIGSLAEVLPPALVRNKATYGILSKGIHALDEASCREYFPVVRAAILQILEQDLRARDEKNAEKDLEIKIAQLSAELKSRGAHSD